MFWGGPVRKNHHVVVTQLSENEGAIAREFLKLCHQQYHEPVVACTQGWILFRWHGMDLTRIWHADSFHDSPIWLVCQLNINGLTNLSTLSNLSTFVNCVLSYQILLFVCKLLDPKVAHCNALFCKRPAWTVFIEYRQGIISETSWYIE